MSAGRPRFVPAAALLPASAEPAPPAGGGEPAAPLSGVAPALAARLARDPARPMVTFYDDATGERVELSTATLDNWVAKTANMLVDTLGLVPGDRVGVDLPAHWMSTVVLLAAWSAGMEVLLAAETGPDGDGGPDAVNALFAAADRLEGDQDRYAGVDIDEIVALSLRPLGGRLARPIPGALDYAAEVLAHGDRFAAPPPPAGQAEMLRLAAAVGSGWQLTADDRVLTAAEPASAAGLVTSLLAPLATGASVVLCRNLDRLDDAALARRIATERVTALDEQVAARITPPEGVRPLPLPPGPLPPVPLPPAAGPAAENATASAAGGRNRRDENGSGAAGDGGNGGNRV